MGSKRKRKLICSSVAIFHHQKPHFLFHPVQMNCGLASNRNYLKQSAWIHPPLHARWMRWTHRGKINIQICITATEPRRTLPRKLFLLFLLVADAFRFPSNIHPSVDRVPEWEERWGEGENINRRRGGCQWKLILINNYLRRIFFENLFKSMDISITCELNCESVWKDWYNKMWNNEITNVTKIIYRTN